MYPTNTTLALRKNWLRLRMSRTEKIPSALAKTVANVNPKS